MNKIFKKTTEKGYMEILKEVGIDTNNPDLDKVGKFISDFTDVIINGIDNTPRGEDTQRDWKRT